MDLNEANRQAWELHAQVMAVVNRYEPTDKVYILERLIARLEVERKETDSWYGKWLEESSTKHQSEGK